MLRWDDRCRLLDFATPAARTVAHGSARCRSRGPNRPACRRSATRCRPHGSRSPDHHARRRSLPTRRRHNARGDVTLKMKRGSQNWNGAVKTILQNWNGLSKLYLLFGYQNYTTAMPSVLFPHNTLRVRSVTRKPLLGTVPGRITCLTYLG
jgi:hypothetical protein